jgi:hypothetical protein
MYLNLWRDAILTAPLGGYEGYELGRLHAEVCVCIPAWMARLWVRFTCVFV